MRKLLMGAGFLMFISSSLAQSGPGGVGNSTGNASQPANVIWLDASRLVQSNGSDLLTWTDVSGNDNHLSAVSAFSPIFRLAGPNGQAYAEFSKSNNRTVLNPFDGMPDQEFTIFMVYKTSDSGEGLMSYAVPGSDNEFLILNNSSLTTYINGGNKNSSVAYNGNSWQLMGMKWRSTDGNLELYKDNSLVYTTTLSSGNTLTTGGAFALGGEQDAVDGGYTSGQAFQGDLAEVIIFDNYLNEAQRILLDNYLSTKYDISLGGNDFYAGDTPGNGDFDMELIGIGQNSGQQHLNAKAAGLRLTPEGTSLDQDNEFVLAGHKTPNNTVSTANLGTGIQQRWLRAWYVDQSGTTGATISFDFDEGIGGQYPGNIANYHLLKWDGSNYEPVSVSSTSISGYELNFELTSAELSDGIYTLGTSNLIDAPLVGVSNKVWYSYQTGDWTDPDTWTLDGGVTPTYNNPSGDIPSSIDDVVITNGRTITTDVDNLSVSSLEVRGILDVANTEGHTFSKILGDGTIRMAGASDQSDNFPSGDVTAFADPVTGGTAVLYGNNDILLDISREFNNVEIDFTTSSDAAFLLNNWTFNGELTVTRGIYQINDNSSTVSRAINALGNVVVQAQGKLLTGTANARHEFNFYGDLINNGGTIEFTNRSAPNYTTEATDGIVDANFLNGSQNQTVECDGPTRFYRIEVDKGDDQTFILNLDASDASNFELLGTANQGHGSAPQLTSNTNSLGLIRGTVKVNTNVTIPRLNAGGNYNISEGARLWVNGGSVTKPAGTAIVIYGTIQVSDGILAAPIQSGLTTRDNGNIIVQGGVMTVNQIRTSVEGVDNIGGYTQSGGTVNITGGSYSTDYYAFSLTYPGNTFTMSGGTLHVSGTSSGGNQGSIFIKCGEGNYSITGGTVIMDNSTNQNFKVSSTAPFWNVIMRHSGGSSDEVELEEGVSGDPGASSSITNPNLRILNDLTIESAVTFDHNGYDVEIGANFTIQSGGDYLYQGSKKNTTTINGTTNSQLAFYNRTGNVNDEQRFWNFVIDKPADKVVTLESGKADRTGNDNNLLRIDGNYFKLLSGTLDNGSHSVRFYTDTLVNYQTVGVYNAANDEPDGTSNGNNDLLKFRPDDFVLITADSSEFGNVRLNNGNKIVKLASDLYIHRLEYKYGRIDLVDNKLTVDILDIRVPGGQVRTDEDPQGNMSVEDMFIMAGNASDGGLSLYVPAGHNNPGFFNMDGVGKTNQEPKLFFFPLGIGDTGSDTDSEFTPAAINLLSSGDDGYINVKTVKSKLPTAGPYPLGTDVSDRYWLVSYEGFSTTPKVEYMWFRSVEKDDPNGGATGFPSNYVPGYVLDGSPFTRNAEISGSAPGTSGFDTDDAEDLRIYFWGNTGSGNPGGGFDLLNAGYTAGDPSKFVGAPVVFYNRNNGRKDWTNNSKWTINSNGSDDGLTSIPGTGDVVVMRNYGGGNQDAWVNLNTNISIAKLIFDDSYGGWIARLSVTKHNALADLGIVSGTGALYVEHTITQQPDFTGSDFGLFASEPNSFFMFRSDANNANPVPLPTNITTYPNIRIEGGDGAFNQRITQNTIPIVINGDMWIDYGGTFSAGDNITIKGDLLVGRGGGSKGLFEIYDSKAITVDIDGNLELTSNANDPRLTVRNNNPNSLEHTIKIGGDFIIQKGVFDVYNGSGTNNNALIEFDGSGSVSFSQASGNVPDLYRINVNKAGNRSDIVDLQANFNLNGPTNVTDKALVLTKGIFRLNNSALSIPLTTSGNFSIPGNAGLQITQGTATVEGDNSGILLDGAIIIDGGTLDMNDAVGNGNNFIEYSSSGNAFVEISSGSLFVGSQLRPLTTAETGILVYRQTGGDVILGMQAAPQNNRGVLQIYNDQSEFIYTGGSLTLSRHQNSPTVAALYLAPANYTVTGTITIFDSNTPASQNDFRINSSIPLADLVIQNTNSPIARLSINPLTIKGTLTIQSGATLDADAIDLTLKGDFVNNGTYVPDNNTTIFTSSEDQSFTGTGSGEFYNLTKLGTGRLTTGKESTVNGLLNLSEGYINDGGNSIYAHGNVLVDGTHESLNKTAGLEFAGAGVQQLYRSTAGTSDLGTIVINNASGVYIPDGNGFDFTLSNALRLESGVFNIGGSLLTLGQLADIISVNPFSVTNMIQTNSSFTDKGVKKIFSANYSSNFTFPVGELLYTPISFDFSTGTNTFGTSSGSITVRPSAEYHPTINDGADYFATGDINNVLQYYWIVDADNIANFSSDVVFSYDQSDVKTNEPGYDESDYIPAQILSDNNPTNAINKFSQAQVNETTNAISFSFTGVTDQGVSGDYFAGIDEAIPNNVTTFTSVMNGSVTAVIYDQVVPGGGAPNGAVLRVANGTTVSFDIDGVNLYKTEIEAGGILEIDETTQHRLGIVTGEGTLKIVSDGSNANLPAGYYTDFFTCSGGGLEYAGTGSYTILGGISTLRHLTVSGSGNRYVANSDINICDDLTIMGVNLYGNGQNKITIGNNVYLESGEFITPAGSGGRVFIYGDLIINGGRYRGSNSSGYTYINGDLRINTGSYELGGQTYRLILKGDLYRSAGEFEGGSSNAYIDFQGGSQQTITGDFNGTNRFRIMRLTNSNNLLLNGNVDVSSEIQFQTGKIITGSNKLLLYNNATVSPGIGKANAYVDGKMYKSIPAGSTFTFPIGKGSIWRYASVTNTSGGPIIWDAEYFLGDPINHSLVDNHAASDPTIVNISNGEYWVISDGSVASTGVTATVGLSWGTESQVAATPSDREKLEVVVWNDGSSSWDNFGGANFSSGHTQTRGYFESGAPIAFSEHIFTLGSTDLANPLPISLEYFKGITSGNVNKLEWVTRSELNNAYFELQRSGDGERYETIYKVGGAGTSQTELSYHFTDTRPMKGVNYYRLRQIDLDGQVNLIDKIVRLVNESDVPYLQVVAYPNPTKANNINLRLDDNLEGDARITMTDLYGRQLYNQVINSASPTLHLNIDTRLPVGVYLVTVQKGLESSTKRIVITE